MFLRHVPNFWQKRFTVLQGQVFIALGERNFLFEQMYSAALGSQGHDTHLVLRSFSKIVHAVSPFDKSYYMKSNMLMFFYSGIRPIDFSRSTFWEFAVRLGRVVV